MMTTYTVTYEDPGFSWAVWQDGKRLAGGYSDTKHSAENDARIWIDANVPVVSPTHADLVDGESYDIGRQGCGVWNAQNQTFTMWDGRVIGVLDTPYSPHANDCLAETLPQSDSVKAHYAQQRLEQAAPELLEALGTLMAEYDRKFGKLVDGNTAFASAYFSARAAIAKATNA